jgi:hypothetical protein
MRKAFFSFFYQFTDYTHIISRQAVFLTKDEKKQKCILTEPYEEGSKRCEVGLTQKEEGEEERGSCTQIRALLKPPIPRSTGIQ